MSLHKAAKEVKIVPIFQSSVPVWCSSPVHAFQTAVEREREKERIEKSIREKGREGCD